MLAACLLHQGDPIARIESPSIALITPFEPPKSGHEDCRTYVWLAPTILQEVLQDRPERFAKWNRVLGELPLLAEPDARAAARAGARLYARCRWAGTTPRSANDCLIAVHAISNRMPLLHCDRDFKFIAEVEPKLVLLPVTQ